MVLKVWDKQKQIERWIKAEAFNPSLFEKRSEIMPFESMDVYQESTIESKITIEDNTNEMGAIKMTDLRKLAKEKGITVHLTDKKADLLAKIEQSNLSNS